MVNISNFTNKDNLMNYLKNLSPESLNDSTIQILYHSISNNIVTLTNESTIQDFESLIKSMDLKSKGFINTTDPSSIPLIGKAWELLSIKDQIDSKVLTENVNRSIIEHLYYLITVIILQRLVNKLIYLNTVSPNGEDLTDFKVLLEEYLRKIDPRIRKYLNGSRVNLIDKIYAGYDTEYETKEYSKVSLLSTQLSFTGTLLIRVNNIDKGFDFNKLLLSDGTTVKDTSYDKLLLKVPPLLTVSLMIQSVIKELRDYMEDSINNEFILQLNELSKQNKIYKTSESDSVVEYMVPLLEENGIPKYENDFKFLEAGQPNPSFTNIIDTITDSTSEMVDERYDYFLKLLNKTVDDTITIDSVVENISMDDTITIDSVVENTSLINDSIVVENIPLINDSNDLKVNEVNEINQDILKSYKYLLVTNNNLNPFIKDNKHPNKLSTSKGVLRGDHRRSKVIILGCHFSIADLSTLSDFDTIKGKFDNLQNTLLTISKPYLISKGRSIYLRDTMLLSPAGSSLEDLGVLYDLPKLSVGNYITRMSDLRDNDPALFKEYAMRDAEITLRHIIEMEKASFKITGLGSVPTTLSSLARKFVFKFWEERGIDLANFINFGKYKIGDFDSLYTPKALQSTGNVGLVLPMFLGSFRGGRNESYAFGIDRNETWYDYDLTSAYTTSMSFLGIPDFDKSFYLTSQKELYTFLKDGLKEITLENCYSVFHVEFKFPETVIHPCLPVSLDDTSTLYPLEGVTITTGYEIYLAHLQGCKITLKRGVVVPFRNEIRPYLDVIKYLQEERRKYPKFSLYNLLYKQLGNSIYGQTAQGFNKMRKFNSRTGMLEGLGTSSLSNPLISSHISGLTRAVLGEIIRQVDTMDSKIISCTTDGFITNVENLPAKLDYDSRLLKIYADLREELSNSREVLELKDSSKGILSWSTRGQLALNPKSRISAMTGFQPRNHSMEERISIVENAFNEESYNIYFGQKSLRKVTDIYKFGGHVTAKITEKVFRIVFDNRRRIIDTGISPSMNLLFSKPFENLDTALTINTIGKLGSDLYAPNTNYTNKSGSKNYIDLAIRSFVRALIQGKLGLVNPFTSYQEIVDYINTTFKVDITANYIASQKRRAFIPRIVPNNEQTRDIVVKLQVKFPDLNVKDFLSS